MMLVRINKEAPRRHRAELEDPCQPYLAAVAEYTGCMRCLSVTGVQRAASVGRLAPVLTERKTKNATKTDSQKRKWWDSPSSSVTFSTASVKPGLPPRGPPV